MPPTECCESTTRLAGDAASTLVIVISSRPINLPALDALRGVLALYVVAGHARWLLWEGHASWITSTHPWWENVAAYASASLRFGHEAVIVFFVLSGFFIHLRSAQQVSQTGSMTPLPLASYAARRAHRLLPAYFFALLVTVVLDFIGREFWPMLYEARTGDAHLDQVFASKVYNTKSTLSALLLVPSSTGQHFGTNGPLWSLAYEVVFYALYPTWHWLRRRSLGFAFGLIPASALVLAWSGVPGFMASVYAHYAVWLAGAALAEILTRTGIKTFHLTFALIFFLAGFALHLVTQNPVLTLFSYICYGAGIVAAAASMSPAIASSSLSRVLEWFGIRSYSIYITHFPWLALLSAMVFQTCGHRPSSGWLALAGFASAAAFGCGCFVVCEKHFLHARLRISSPLPT